MSKVATIDSIVKEAKKYLPKLNEERVRNAYAFAEKAHEGQVRSSGEPYIQHPLEVAKILLELQPDEDSLIAALLHDVLEDTDTKLETLTSRFGKTLSPLLSGLEKLGKVHYRGEERQIENLRKMFMAMAKDIRVILIKLTDRLHNMRTLEFIPGHKQERIARETLTIYAPIAGRLGIYRIKDELEDLAFQYLYPEACSRIKKEIQELTGVQENISKTSQRILAQALKKAGIEATIEGRLKHYYSIYKKLRRKEKNYVSELYDVLALRIIVNTEAECYQALGIIHKNWTPLARRFKDYIAVPKPNGYQSLHTTLIGLCPNIHNQPIEVQIRTQEMNLVAKLGVAAHWHYKEKGGELISEDKLKWVKKLIDLHESLKSNTEFIESLNVDIFQDRIFVLSPKGDAFDLPVGATPVDFAYTIHTDVGNHCKAAKVNGSIVPLNYHLKNGEVVEILTSPTTEPNRYWLSFVTTSQSKQRIKQWFNSQDRGRLIKIGKDLLNTQLKRLGYPPLDPNMTWLKTMDGAKLNIQERETVLEKIGNGSLDVVTIAKKIIPMDQKPEKLNGDSSAKLTKQMLTEGVKLEEDKAEILITGERGYKTQIASCCNPKPALPIIGYVTRGKGVTIHEEHCKVLRGNDSKRLIKASWSTEKTHAFVATLAIERRSRIGLLRDVAEVFASNQIPILDITNRNYEESDLGEIRIIASFDRPETLQFVIDQLKEVPEVFKVKECE